MDGSICWLTVDVDAPQLPSVLAREKQVAESVADLIRHTETTTLLHLLLYLCQSLKSQRIQIRELDQLSVERIRVALAALLVDDAVFEKFPPHVWISVVKTIVVTVELVPRDTQIALLEAFELQLGRAVLQEIIAGMTHLRRAALESLLSLLKRDRMNQRHVVAVFGPWLLLAHNDTAVVSYRAMQCATDILELLMSDSKLFFASVVSSSPDTVDGASADEKSPRHKPSFFLGGPGGGPDAVGASEDKRLNLSSGNLNLLPMMKRLSFSSRRSSSESSSSFRVNIGSVGIGGGGSSSAPAAGAQQQLTPRSSALAMMPAKSKQELLKELGKMPPPPPPVPVPLQSATSKAMMASARRRGSVGKDDRDKAGV